MPTATNHCRFQPGLPHAASVARAVLPLSTGIVRTLRGGWLTALSSDGMECIDRTSKPGRARFGRDDP